MLAPLRFYTQLGWRFGGGLFTFDKNWAMVRKAPALIPRDIHLHSRINSDEGERGAREGEENSVNSSEGKGVRVDVRWHWKVHLHQIHKKGIPSFLERSGKILLPADKGSGQRRCIRKRQLHRPFRSKIEISHHPHRMSIRMLSALSPDSLNLPYKQGSGGSRETKIVDEEGFKTLQSISRLQRSQDGPPWNKFLETTLRGVVEN